MFLSQTLRATMSGPFYVRNLLKQMEQIGVNSIPVVLTTALSTGMVLALQSYTGFKRFGAETLIGTVVSLSMTRELGPVLTGLMVAGRAGASMAAELGTMKVTEQIDAMETLATSPMKYLVVPTVRCEHDDDVLSHGAGHDHRHYRRLFRGGQGARHEPGHLYQQEHQ